MKTKTSIALKNLKITTNTYLHNLIQSARSIQDNYEDDIYVIKEELLVKIANDYSLDVNELKSRYLRKKKSKEQKNDNLNSLIDIEDDTDNKSEYEYTNSNVKVNQRSEEDKDVLFKITHEDNDYYLEPFEGGKVYDNKKNIVGVWKDEQMELYMDVIKNLHETTLSLESIQLQNVDNLDIENKTVETVETVEPKNDVPVRRKPGRIPKKKAITQSGVTII